MDASRTREVLEFGEFLLDVGQRTLCSRTTGEPIRLTPKAVDTLLVLIAHRDELVDKSTLLSSVWPNVVVEENNLNQVISALRKALGDSAGQHRFIATAPGRGYRFIAPVTPVAVPETVGSSDLLRGYPARSPPAATATQPGTRFPASRVLVASALGLAIAIGVWLLARVERGGSPALPSAATETATGSGAAQEPRPAIGRLRLAILPFQNLSQDPADAFFTEGLHEEILSTMARQLPELDVISRTTMMAYRSAPVTAQKVARDLDATHLITGSVRREGSTVRVTLHLVDTRSDRLLWSQNYDRSLSSVLTLQSDVAADVASQLSVRLAVASQAGAPPTTSPEAYDFYLKALVARQYLTPFAPIERYLEVDQLLTQAIALDPSFASAYAQRATFREVMFAFNYDVSEEHLRRIREDIDAALRLAPADPLPLAAQASYLSWVERDLSGALRAFQTAEAMHLADPMFLLGKSGVFMRLGRVDESAHLNARLMAIDPGNPFIINGTAVGLAYVGKPQEALRVLKRGLELFPGDPWMALARAQIIFDYTGRLDEWRAALNRADAQTTPEVLVEQHFSLLRLENRYTELKELLDGIPARAIRVPAGMAASTYYGAGERPIAEYRGWTALLMGDADTAAKQGRAVLQFLGNVNETPRNAWFRRLLLAEASVFLGESARAITHAREAVTLMPSSRDALTALQVSFRASAVYAWSGAQDEAVALLVEHAAAVPGIPPAHIARDPLISVPLAHTPRYRALVVQLEDQMRATGL